MPQFGTEEKCLFGQIFLLLNLVDYKNNSYPTNIELLKYATQLLKDKKYIYPTWRLPDKSFTQNISLRPQPEP